MTAAASDEAASAGDAPRADAWRELSWLGLAQSFSVVDTAAAHDQGYALSGGA